MQVQPGKLIVVKQLMVRVVTGEPSEDPYGQGFSAISATVDATDKELIDELTEAKQLRAPVTLRCAMLDVAGPITNAVVKGDAVEFVLVVRDLCYRKPGATYEVTKR